MSNIQAKSKDSSFTLLAKNCCLKISDKSVTYENPGGLSYVTNFSHIFTFSMLKCGEYASQNKNQLILILGS